MHSRDVFSKARAAVALSVLVMVLGVGCRGAVIMPGTADGSTSETADGDSCNMTCGTTCCPSTSDMCCDTACCSSSTMQYLAVHVQDTLTPPNPTTEPYRWYVGDPASFTRGWDDILTTVGTRGTPHRRLAVAYTFAYFRHPMESTIASIQNMMWIAEEKEVPIYIHLDGVMYWRGTGLWNWWNPDADPNDPSAKFDLDNKNNVERYGWDMGTALKIAWRNWGTQERVEYRYSDGMAVPTPNLASSKFRQKNAEALSEILPVIMNWYNKLPSDKKYLLAGVVLGMELSTEMNAFYYRSPPWCVNSCFDGNSYCDSDPKDDEASGLKKGQNTVRLGYAAAQTLGLQPDGGTITGGTIDLVLNDYFEFLIGESLKSGIPPSKLITHAFPPAAPGEWYGVFDHMEAAMSKVDGVVAGWTAPIESYDQRINLDTLDGRPWAAIETHFWSVNDKPTDARDEYIRDELPGRLSGIFNYGNCRHVNIKNWEQMKPDQGFLNAIRAALSIDPG